MGLGLWMVILVGTVFLAPTTSARRRDRTAPHDHRGKLAPYPAGPFPALRLTASDEATLQSGHPVTKQSVPSGSGKDDDKPGTVLCIQDVQAPLAAVWHQILGMDDYSKKVSKVTECRNYFVSKLNASGQVRIKTKQVLGVLPGYSVRSRRCCLLAAACYCVCCVWVRGG